MAPVASKSALLGLAPSASGSMGERRSGLAEGAKAAGAWLDWADLLQRTFAIDVLQCTRCGQRRRVLAHVTGKSAKAILGHLGLPSRPPTLAPARGPPEPSWLH
ncbi:MAG: hypothetical protein ACKVPX_03780 [Myxococcaceae bacterium]